MIKIMMLTGYIDDITDVNSIVDTKNFTPIEGELIYDLSEKTLYKRVDSKWKRLTKGLEYGV